MIYAYDTWWGMGRSYLCRICNMLHMGMVDEVLFGKEVVERLPVLVNEWVKQMEGGPKHHVYDASKEFIEEPFHTKNNHKVKRGNQTLFDI